MSCKTCTAPAGTSTCDLAWACDVRANTLLCTTCGHPFWSHGAEHDDRCYEDACACEEWKPGPVAPRRCIACGGALGTADKGTRHEDLAWCQEWGFWIECANCQHPWSEHDSETSSCLGDENDFCACTEWKPVAKRGFSSPEPQTSDASLN